jgi:flagellar basal body-associated protein FliL
LPTLGGGDGPNGDGPGVTKKKMLPVLIVVSLLIFVTLLSVVFFIMYKKKQAHNETAPLNQVQEPANRP